jgi:hypothetical protein
VISLKKKKNRNVYSSALSLSLHALGQKVETLRMRTRKEEKAVQFSISFLFVYSSIKKIGMEICDVEVCPLYLSLSLSIEF